MRSGEDLRCLLKLLQEGRAPFEALTLRFPIGRLLFPSEALCLVPLGGHVGKVPCSDVDFSHLLAIPAALIVVDAAVALLQSHLRLREVTKSGRTAERSTCTHYSSSHLRWGMSALAALRYLFLYLLSTLPHVVLHLGFIHL